MKSQHLTLKLLTISMLATAAISFSSISAELTTAEQDTVVTQQKLKGGEILAHYGIDDDLARLGFSTLLAGEHLVEEVDRTVTIGDEKRYSRVFFVKNTNVKGIIDLRIKYNSSELDNHDDAIAEIEKNTKTEYRLRDYAQSYDPKTVTAVEHEDGSATISFNYSKFGLPQDIAYFRFMKVEIKVKDQQPVEMIISNSKPFNYDGYYVESYEQHITFGKASNGKLMFKHKQVEASGMKKDKSVALTMNVKPIALYNDDNSIEVMHSELLQEVSDPRMQELNVKLDRVFPLMGDLVRKQGIDVPLPFGVSMAYRNQDMNLPFTDFNIMGVGLNEFFDPEQSFGIVNAQSFSIRGDVNILPFWNVYGVLGKVNVDATVDAQYTGEFGHIIQDKLNDKLPGMGNLFCNKVSALCNEATLHVPLELNYDLAGIGTTLSVGYKNFFASVTGTYAITRLEGNDEWGDPILTIQPMLGYQLPDYRAQIFVGAEYQGLKPTMSGTIDSVMIGDRPFEFDVGLDMNKWAYLIGFNKQFGKNYNMTLLYNKGETRDSLTLNFGYRF